MKRFGFTLTLGLLYLLLTGCIASVPETPSLETPPVVEHSAETTPVVESPAPFVFTRENMPRLDGSTSTAPLGEAVCSVLLGEERAAVADLVQFNKTTTAYYSLMYGDADLLIVGEDNASILAERERLGFEWERAPFANDAFIFVVHEDNPVDSITIEQARGIYTGEITNWSELGGEDCPILPFQRNRDAGSQNLMEKLVMQGTAMMAAPSDYIVISMGQLMEVVKNYDGSRGAIGYTVYYYAEEMKMAQGLKILALEGIVPGPDTIRSEEYPLLNPKYVVIPADAPQDAPNRRLFNWLLGEEGQQLVAREGYVSVAASRLPAVGARRYAEYTDKLIPRDDYGALIPYAGARLMADWPSDTGCIYGLMTEEGVAVTDPIYSDVYRAGFNDGGKYALHPLLVLRRGEREEGAQAWEVESQYAIAAADGSWCTEFRYHAWRSSEQGVLLFAGDEVTHMSPTGKVLKKWSLSALGLTQEEIDSLYGDLMWGGGWGGQWSGDYLTLDPIDDYTAYALVNLSDGRRATMTNEEWDAYAQSQYVPIAEPTQEELLALLPPEAEGPVQPLTNLFTDTGLPGLLLAYHETDMLVFLPDGTPLPTLTRTAAWDSRIRPVGKLIEVLDLNTASYYDRDTMECVFRAYLGYEAD